MILVHKLLLICLNLALPINNVFVIPCIISKTKLPVFYLIVQIKFIYKFPSKNLKGSKRYLNISIPDFLHLVNFISFNILIDDSMGIETACLNTCASIHRTNINSWKEYLAAAGNKLENVY